MRFTCTQQALNKAINTVIKAVSSRTTIPILKGILFKVEGGELILLSSNLDISIETRIPVQDAEEGSCVINARLISEIVRRLPNSLMSFSSDERDNLKLVCLGSEFMIVTMSADEYPQTINSAEGDQCSVNIKEICELVRKTSFAASIDEKKGILTGCLLKFKNDGMEMVALDGFRMAIARTDALSGIEGKIVIPASLMNDVSKLIAEAEESEEVVINIDPKRVGFRYDSTKISVRQLEGEFIAYEGILPKEWKTRFTVEREELMSSIERASLFAKEGKNNLIKMNILPGIIKINSRSEEGNVNESVLAETEGSDLLIGFNSKYIIDTLRAVDDESMSFEMTGSNSACLIKPVEGDDFVYLVLPVRMTV